MRVVVVVAFLWDVRGRLADGTMSLFVCKMFMSYSLYK